MSSTWEGWYPQKEKKVEPDIYTLEPIFSKNNVRRILDFGCGTGRHSLYFARKGYDVYGFDGSEGAIQRAKELANAENLRVDFRVWDMTKRLPYHDNFFNSVLAIRVIHHTMVENIRRIVIEMDRVLVSGGYIFLQVPEYQGHLKFMRDAPKTHVETEPGTHVPLEGPEKNVPHHHFKEEELLGLFPNYATEFIHSYSDHYGGFCLAIRKTGKKRTFRENA